MKYRNCRWMGWLVVLWAGAALAQATPPRKIDVYPVKDGFQLIRAIGNITVFAGEEGVLLADTGEASFAPQVLEAVRQITPKPIRYIVNSHWHYDHVGGNALLGPEAIRIAHARTAALLAMHRTQFGQSYAPLSAEGLPNLTYDTSLSIRLNGERIRILHPPDSHTGGDSMIYFENARVLHTGDLFFLNRLPFVDLQSGGTVEGYTAAVGSLLEWLPDDVTIIPGHGRIATKSDLRAYHAMLTGTGNQVRARIEQGVDLDRILQEGLDEKWKSWEWSNAFVNRERWIRLIYQSHTGQIANLFEPGGE